MSAQFVAGLLALAACCMVLWRVDKMMKGITRPEVFRQHGVIALGMFGAFVLSFTDAPEWSGACGAAGVVMFFALGTNRWRHGAPEDTTKPGALGPAEFTHIAGGQK